MNDEKVARPSRRLRSTLDRVLVHDIKNMGFRLQLLLTNLEEHYGDPEFKRSVQELLAQAKTKSLNFASPGVGLASHIASELLKLQTQSNMVHVPYKGGGPALTDIMGGHVDMMFIPISSAMPLVQSGRLRALTIVRKERSPRPPNVPTIAEAGMANFDIAEWWGLLAPARTARSAVNRLRAETVRAVERPEVADRLGAAGVEMITSTPEELREYVVVEIRKYRDIIQRAGIRAN